MSAFSAAAPAIPRGVSKLVEGMDIDEVIKRTDGILCGARPTSCPDQLARGIKAVQSPAEFLNQGSFAASDNKDLEMSKKPESHFSRLFQFIFFREGLSFRHDLQNANPLSVLLMRNIFLYCRIVMIPHRSSPFKNMYLYN